MMHAMSHGESQCGQQPHNDNPAYVVHLPNVEPKQHLYVEEQLHLQRPVRPIQVASSEKLLKHGQVQHELAWSQALFGQADGVDKEGAKCKGSPIGWIQAREARHHEVHGGVRALKRHEDDEAANQEE